MIMVERPLSLSTGQKMSAELKTGKWQRREKDEQQSDSDSSASLLGSLEYLYSLLADAASNFGFDEGCR